jgi:hypothetical protein
MRLARDHARPRRPRLHPRGRSARPQRALAVDPAGQGSAFAPIPGVDLDEILCVQEERQVMNGNCVSYRTLKLQIPESPVRLHFVKARVKVHVDPDGSHALFHRPRCIGRYDEKGRLKDDGPRPARRLTPLGGAPVEMGTTLPLAHIPTATKPEEADNGCATNSGQLILIRYRHKLPTDLRSDEFLRDELFRPPPEDSSIGQGRGELDNPPTNRPNRGSSRPIAVATRDLNALFDHLRQREGPLLANVANDQMAASVARPPGQRQVAAPL